jgi:Family of unknown function (DUF5678)
MPEALERDEETYALDPAVWNEIMSHPGKWVVATETEVIDFGDDPAALLKEAGARGVDNPMLFNVPEDPGVSFLL